MNLNGLSCWWRSLMLSSARRRNAASGSLRQDEFTDEQRALRDVARDLFAKQSQPSLIRERWKGERDPKLWRALAEVGLLGVIVPEQFGGSSGDEIDLALVLEEAGRAALPEPFVETVVASRLIELHGDDVLSESWLPRIAQGDVVATIGLETDPFRYP